MNSAVVICLDKNKFVEQEFGPPIKYFYESEAIACVKSWRNAAQWNNSIYAIEYIGREVSDFTKKQLNNLGVKIISLPFPDIKYKFMEVVYALKSIETENIINEDRIFYSDLDIIMQQPVPKNFFDPTNIVLYYYDFNKLNYVMDSKEFIYRLTNGNRLNIKCHNTYFQVFNKNGNFQQTVFNISKTEEYIKFFNDYIYYKPLEDDYFFEEGLYDYVCLNYKNKFNILDIECPANFFKHIHAHKQYLK